MTEKLAAQSCASPLPSKDRHAIIPSLDGLRAISIAFVILGHSIKYGTKSFLYRLVAEHAGLGVYVFFVISGFLITHLLLREREKFGSISLRLFYYRRALRILPAFLLFVGTVAILAGLGLAYVPRVFWVYVFTWTVNFAPLTHRSWVLAHLWSLSVEEQFYLLWPLAIRVGKKRSWVVVAVLAVFAGAITHTLHTIFHFHLTLDAFPYVCGAIGMGCLLALYAGPVRQAITGSRILSSGWLLAAAAVLVLLLDATEGMSAPLTVLTQIVVNVLLTFCVAHVVFVPIGVGYAILNSAPFVFVGRLSYSLYLWQQLFTNPLGAPVIPISFPANVIFIFAVALVSYYGLELRFIKWRKKARRV